jgi:hypothetical protein
VSSIEGLLMLFAKGDSKSGAKALKRQPVAGWLLPHRRRVSPQVSLRQ